MLGLFELLGALPDPVIGGLVGDTGVDGGVVAARYTYAGDGFACSVNPGSTDASGLAALCLGALAVAIPSLRRRRRSSRK